MRVECRDVREESRTLQFLTLPSTLHSSTIMGHHLTVLLIRKAHSQVLHNGIKETLAELQLKFWIVKGRNLVKSVVCPYHVCRRHEGKPYSVPSPPLLPAFQVEEPPLFSFTGVDFAGPLYVKGDHDVKVWICLYICCVVRTVHLDLVPDLYTPAFLQSFRHFIPRRGPSYKILSDNGKTFKAAARAIREVKWIFNVPKAPWWGGVFEQIVRCTKRCLRKIIGQAKFSQDKLLTAITDGGGDKLPAFVIHVRLMTWTSH